MIRRSSFNFAASWTRRVQYSSAVAGSWREQGPQMTRRRSEVCLIISTASLRPLRTVGMEFAGAGCSDVRSWGGINGS